MFTHADNDQINSVLDLKDKVIGAGGITMLMAAQLQFYEMQLAGMSYVMDPKQVVFTGNQLDVIQGVLDKNFDVGFVRTDEIETFILPNGEPLDAAVFKIIEPKVFVLDDGTLFPFLHSTEVYPEWPFAALDHVPKDVAEAVQEALLSLEDHAIAAESNLYTRCDTTPQLAELAARASRSGSLAGFRTPMSYFQVRTMHEEAGFMKKDEYGQWACIRADTLYGGIACPAGHYKLAEDDFNQSCQNQGLLCNEGYECYCKPCVKDFEVDVFQFKETEHNDDHTGCEKMSMCGVVEQTKDITLRIFDNLQRQGAQISAVLHFGDNDIDLPIREVEGTPWTYEAHWSEQYLGVALVEVAVNGVQIPESPVRIQVVHRDCAADFPGQGKMAADNGNCECGGSTVDIAGKCVKTAAIAASVSVAAFLVMVVIGFYIVKARNHKADVMWHVAVDELQFDDPVEVIGQGSFGVVLLAEYRGTKVAIKRALKTGSGGSTKAGSNKYSSAKRVAGAGGSVVLRGSDDNFLASSDEVTHDSCDIECHPDAAHSKDSILLEGASKKGSSDDFNLDFLNDDYGRKGKWARLFPWTKESDYQSRFKQSILGDSGTTSRKSGAAMLCPWFNAQARREEEFVNEMRILSRLRHPCITTVMGAVITRTHDPMLVMEYMEYGSLHDLLRNETMYLTGEIIMQIARDVSCFRVFTLCIV